MKTVYKTKRDTNGNTNYLTLDHDAKTYNTQYTRDAATITTRRDLRRLIDDAERDGYTEKLYL